MTFTSFMRNLHCEAQRQQRCNETPIFLWRKKRKSRPQKKIFTSRRIYSRYFLNKFFSTDFYVFYVWRYFYIFTSFLRIFMFFMSTFYTFREIAFTSYLRIFTLYALRYFSLLRPFFIRLYVVYAIYLQHVKIWA